MFDKAKYVNHLNQVIEFGSGGVFISNSELRDYEWYYDTNYDEVTNFRKDVVKKKMKIIIIAQSESAGLEIKNDIYEVFEKDVLANTQGKLYIGAYSCTGYIISSKKLKWLISKKYLEMEVAFVTDNPDWTKETIFEYKKRESEEIIANDVKSYPNTYGYVYSNRNASGTIINDALSDTNFILRLYGDIINPIISVGGNTYQVNVSIGTGERLEIDSKNKTIFLIKHDGSKENVFWYASKQSYIFERIQTGAIQVAWDGTFSFDLILIDKRSEPPWT